jgi:hypothetical protein
VWTGTVGPKAPNVDSDLPENPGLELMIPPH